MKCVGIIWNCALPCENEILNLIEDNSEIISTFILHLGNSFESFVRQIYSVDSIADWKVEEKIRHMKSSSSVTDIRVIIFEIEVTEKFYHSFKRDYVYSKLELLKSIIRITCMNKIADYFFDIVFHSSETEEEFQYDMQVIEMYKDC